MKQILDAFNKLEAYIEKEEFKGYDPYDTLNSWIPFKLLGKWPAAIATQIQKRNPINIRPLLGIKKEKNPKAFGLFLQAYSILYQKTKNPDYLEKANYFYTWLNNNYSKGYSGKCWGYNFPWANPKEYKAAFIPSSVVTGLVVKGLYEYYIITKRNNVINLIESACLFLEKDLLRFENEEGISFSYTPITKDICYNASLLAGESFARLFSIKPDKIEYRNLAIKSVDFVIKRQHKDGKWNYAIDLDLKKEQQQIDFHQGYVLESIYEIKRLLNIDNKKWEITLKNGLNYYINKQFHNSGRSYWRLPKKFPVDIHNQSQGIITLLKLKGYNYKTLSFVKKIAEWTINNMQSKGGHFYYQIFKTHKNRISYMRWNNAWMFLALSLLLTEKK